METRQLHWNVSSVMRRKPKINPQPQYQRTPVWSEDKKQLLIDSILRQYDIPKIYLRKSAPPYEHEVIDGQQRLRTVWEFIDGDFVLGDSSRNLPEYGDLSGKKYSELDSDVQDKIADYDFIVIEVLEATDFEIRDLFLRLQEGVSLNPAEKRNALFGNMRDFVADLGENHKVFPLTFLPEKRFGWHSLAAIITCLELAEGPTDVKSPSLRKMYLDHQDFDKEGTTARKIKRHLNYLKRIIKDRPPEMDIKWGFVDLYLLVLVMDESFVLGNIEGEFTDFYVAFESERRSAMPDYGELRSAGRSLWDKDMYQYIEAFVRSGGTKQNIDKRNRTYSRRSIRDMSNLVPKDPDRSFSRDERIVIWRRDDRKCKFCGKPISLQEMEADHIQPHAAGGKTIVSNGRALCRPCHTERHSG